MSWQGRVAAGGDGALDLGSQTYQRILQRLLSLSITPGNRLSIDALARELGVSQTPVRAALSRLENEGLVTKYHLRGFRAAPTLTKAELEDLFELRIALEPLAAARTARRHSTEQLSILSQDVESMNMLARGDDTESRAAFATMDAEFHDHVADFSGNRFIRATLSHLHIHVQIFRLSQQKRIRTDAEKEHIDILRAIRATDPDGASASMRGHLMRSRARFMRALS